MAHPPPRVHYRERGQRFALCGRRTSRTTPHIALTTCAQCRELHRQRAAVAGGHVRRLYAP